MFIFLHLQLDSALPGGDCTRLQNENNMRKGQTVVFSKAPCIRIVCIMCIRPAKSSRTSDVTVARETCPCWCFRSVYRRRRLVCICAVVTSAVHRVTRSSSARTTVTATEVTTARRICMYTCVCVIIIVVRHASNSKTKLTKIKKSVHGILNFRQVDKNHVLSDRCTIVINAPSTIYLYTESWSDSTIVPLITRRNIF